MTKDDTDDIEIGAEDSVFIRQDMYRTFAVLKIGKQEILERLPYGIKYWPEHQLRKHLEKVAERLIKRASYH